MLQVERRGASWWVVLIGEIGEPIASRSAVEADISRLPPTERPRCRMPGWAGRRL